MRHARPSILAALIILTGAAACAKKAPPAAPPPAPPPVVEAAPPAPPPPAPQPPPAPVAALTEDEIFARKTVAELNAEMPLADVLFDLDSSNVRDDARTVLQRNMQWLSRWTSVRVTVEGHCDSRGTAEYNLALGERRSDAIQDYLAGLGISRDRVLVVTKGEESPVCSEETETCWQQNRRGHFVITAK